MVPKRRRLFQKLWKIDKLWKNKHFIDVETQAAWADAQNIGKFFNYLFFLFSIFFSFLLHNFFAADFFPHNFWSFDASLLVLSTQVPGIRLGMWSGTIGWWDDWNGQWTLRDLKNVVQFEAFYWIMLVKCRVGLGRGRKARLIGRDVDDPEDFLPSEDFLLRYDG